MKRPPPLSTPRPPRTRRPAVRTLLLFLLLLVAGAAVNVAVAWGLEIFSTGTTWSSIRVCIGELPDALRWQAIRLDRPGQMRITSHVFAPTEELGPGWADPFQAIEPWSRLPDRQDAGAEWEENATGWPCVSMWSRLTVLDRLHLVDFGTPTPRVLPFDRLDRAWLIDWPFLPNQIVLPLGPIVAGFTINTVLYAAICWLLFAAPFAVRRRRRIKRGLCPACAYPVGTNEVCTECGKPVKTQTAEAAS